jgi:hypothetical protein
VRSCSRSPSFPPHLILYRQEQKSPRDKVLSSRAPGTRDKVCWKLLWWPRPYVAADGAGSAPSSPGRGGSGRGARLSSAPLAAVVGGRRVQPRAQASASWGRPSRRKFGGRKGGWDERDKTFSRRRVHMGLERRRCWPLVARHDETAARSTRMAKMAIAARPKQPQWKTGTGVAAQYPVARPPCCCCPSPQLPRASRLCSRTLASEAIQEDVALDAATGAENCRPDKRLG